MTRTGRHQGWLATHSPKGQLDPRLEEIHWTVEELRVSLFTRQLKTAYPVSLKHIRRRWRELRL